MTEPNVNCDWMDLANKRTVVSKRTGKSYQTGDRVRCCLPAVAVVDPNLLNKHRAYPPYRTVCIFHARAYFYKLNRERGNVEYAPFVKHQQKLRAREEERRRLRAARHASRRPQS